MTRFRGRGPRTIVRRAPAIAALAVAALWLQAAADPIPDWLSVDYSELVDRRRPSHSGETVGDLLRKLEGRALPAPGQRHEDRVAHGLLDPLVEPYAFVMPDALDTLGAQHEPPYVDVGSLWFPGEAQPAWVELLRARRYLVQSDGEGSLRLFLPLPPADGAQPDGDASSVAAANRAWSAAWPLMRHVFAAERRRLSDDPEGLPPLRVVVHAYRHRRAQSMFELGTGVAEFAVDDPRPDGRRAPFDLRAIRRFLGGGLRLEGARLDALGSLRLLGSRIEGESTILGRPLAASDFAVAYRAVFHGGLAEPYMSLDRGFFAESSIVNYGGRLRDTSLGMVSLLCDIRFKTFSLGLDVARGTDRREELRAALPGFLTHMEQLARDPRSVGLVRQQTRLWFYPDEVDLTVSPQGDVLVLRTVRMAAASERFDLAEGESKAAGAAPWTRTSVRSINLEYDSLAKIFPEMADLDQVVRLLSLFAWLKAIEPSGRPLPDLDSLLAVKLPEQPTPRSFPQLIAFNVLPPPESERPILVIDLVPDATAIGRLNPRSGIPLTARRRYARAVAALDRQEPRHAAMLAELDRVDVEALDDSAIDMLAYRIGRSVLLGRTSSRHYQRVLGKLDPEARDELAQRQRSGEALRPITLGIGGLDLDMGQAIARAGGRQMELASLVGTPVATARPGRATPSPESGVPASTAVQREPREEWRREPRGVPEVALPQHGINAKDSDRFRVEVSDSRSGDESRWIRVVYDAGSPEARSRMVVTDGSGRAVRFERLDDRRFLTYRFARQGPVVAARIEPPRPSPAPDLVVEPDALLPPALVLLELRSELEAIVDPPRVQIRIEGTVARERRGMESAVPRPVLQRVVRGPADDPTPDRPLPEIVPPTFSDTDTVMVLTDPEYWAAPWLAGAPPRPGEEDPRRVASGLRSLWAAARSGRDVVVGVSRDDSPGRWADAPDVGSDALLLLPTAGFAPGDDRADALASAWGRLSRAESLNEDDAPNLVVLVSAEPPGRFAQRLRALAANPSMEGKLLAAWSLAGPVRRDLPAQLLAEGNLAGVGLGPASLATQRHAARDLESLAEALQLRDRTASRAERLPGPFVWHY